MITEKTSLQETLQIGKERYKQVKVSIAPAIASAFKQACDSSEISMAATLSQFMADFSNISLAKKPLPDYSTRRQRRKAIGAMVKQLEMIRDCEEEHRDRIPENLQESMVYDRADELVSTLDEAIELLVSCMVP